MSAELTTDSASHAPASDPAPWPSRVVSTLVDAVIVAAWFVVAGLVGGWVWAQVTSLPQVTKQGNSATVPADELAKQVGMDGWFFLIAAVGGVLSGVLLLVWRHRDPLLTVALVALGGGLASWLMLRTGEALGPGDPIAALRKLPNGAHVSEQLHLHAQGVAWVWPIAAAFGALLYLWVFSKPGGDQSATDTLH
jgi:hypothetical protein